MQDEVVRYSAGALEAGRAIEAAEGDAMAEAWWRRAVVPRIVASRERLRALERGAQPTEGVDMERWRRVARLPVLVRALPGFADLWRQVVPREALERTGDMVSITCRCGERSELDVGTVVFCACGTRWFLRTARDVRVKVWPAEDAS